MITTSNHIEDNALSRILSLRLDLNWQLAVYILIFLLAVFSRFYMLGERVMSHDESLHTRYSYNFYKEGDFAHTPLMHGPVLFHATALSFYFFGDSDFSGRLYTAVLGVMLVMFPLLWRRWLGRWGSLLASLMILISPLLLYYSRYIRHDTPSILFGMIMAYCILQYLDGGARVRGRAYWLYLFAAALILNLGSKETAFIYLGILGSFLTIFFLARLAQARLDLRGKPLFQQVVLGILLGGMMTLGMYILVDIIPAQIVPGRGTSWGALSDLQRSTFAGWMTLAVGSGGFVLSTTALYAFRDSRRRIPWRELVFIFLIALLTAGGLLFIEELSHWSQSSAPTDTAAEDSAAAPISWLPAVALWAVAIGISAMLLRDRRRVRIAEPASGDSSGGIWGYLRQFPEVDFLVLMLTLILPWTTALFTRMMGGSSDAFAALATALPEGVNRLLATVPGVGGEVGQFVAGASVFLPLTLLSLVIGLSWNRRPWLISAAIFHAIFAIFFTSAFTNIAGLGTGMIYSLGYWLEQQGVRRGSQPQYYYLLIILPTYAFLPIIGSVCAMFAGITGYWKTRRERIVQREAQQQLVADATEQGDHEDEEPSARIVRGASTGAGKLRRLPFVLLLAWWAILSLVGYSLAGEKMPWLGTHMALPMILLSAWYFGGVISRIDQRKLWGGGWLALLAMPVFVIATAQTVGAFVIGDPPFMGLALHQLERTYQWLAGLLVAVGSGALLARQSRGLGWMHLRRLCALTIFALLCALTARAAWVASFINYDLPTELLVYAHSAPGVKRALADINEMSLRATDGKDLRFAYDDEVSWPYSWYFRDFPNAVFVGANPTLQNTEGAAFVVVGAGKSGVVEPILEDRYFRREYIRMWWPMQEYFGLTPERLLNVLDFSPGNTQAAALRRGIFDIWWMRDYDQYASAADKDFSLTNWPVADRMHVFVHKDFATEIWEYGVGDGEVPVAAPSEVNQCAANWQPHLPLGGFDTSALIMQRPLALTVADERVYVADENAHQVQVFSTGDGSPLRTYGDDDSIRFNRPNSVAVLPNGELLVVDTWNYRIQHIDEQGSHIYSWGEPGEFGFSAPADPTHGFWGPRDVLIDSVGRIFIADTGNKRIRVYQLEAGLAVHQFDIGSGGSAPGELDEPVGLAAASDGRLYIANTWNRRVSVFQSSGSHQADFRVRGWYSNSFNRPYLALDENRDLLYITDPDSHRILVHNLAGDCIGSFGEQGEIGSSGQFQDIGGIAVDAAGFIYVSDSSAGRLVKFPPFARG
ncbi:MAG: TIGR03663 family protein [Chloroflexi bacterium]|nr:TIGR03663 family protein [Chloroflexota bacterium]MCY4248416.1 TIGR03663 family protein [Chloroflexota bacterium]